MQRLSEKAIKINDDEVFAKCEYSSYVIITDALNRLAKYENSGLEPDAVKTAKSLSVQFVNQIIEENNLSIQKALKKGINPTCIQDANEMLKKTLKRLS